MDRKEQILAALHSFIRQRPGMDPRNYGGGIEGWRAYQSESRSITRDRHDAEQLLGFVARAASMSSETLEGGFRAFSGRLTLTNTEQGGVALDYCTGQYFPTEYRKAVCAVCASALWDHFREESDTGDTLRRKLRNVVGARLQKRWMD